MTSTTEHVLEFLKGKSPGEIEKVLSNLQRMSTAQAQESGEIAAKQQAADAAMSLAEVQVKLEKAVGANDLEALQRWQPLHLEKLRWIQNQVQANEDARVAKINQPLIEKRQARRNELLTELNELTKRNVSQNLDRIGAIQEELGVLS